MIRNKSPRIHTKLVVFDYDLQSIKEIFIVLLCPKYLQPVDAMSHYMSEIRQPVEWSVPGQSQRGPLATMLRISASSFLPQALSAPTSPKFSRTA